jgi:putative endonuclease
VKTKYLNMIRKMASGGDKAWSVYMVRCGDGTFYTGIAKDVALRLKAHNAGKGAAYTRAHLPVSLLFQRSGLTRSEALVEEARIKALPRSKKEQLIAVRRTRRP